MSKKGILTVVSGFSGSGKGTVMSGLLKAHSEYALSVSATTRDPRPGEVHGVNYFFVSKEEFREMISGNALYEYAEYSGNFYGTPKEYVDNVAGEVKRIWDLMNSSYNKFMRTTDEDHEKVVQKIFKKLYDQGDIYKSAYEGLYCTPCESFWTESQLVDGKCPDCGREVKPAKEEAYFFISIPIRNSFSRFPAKMR